MDPALIGLAGVVIGGAFSFLGQWILATGARRDRREIREETRRAERVQAVREFLAEAQTVEAYAVALFQDGIRPNPGATDRLWLLAKQLGVLTSSDMHDAAYAYARSLNHLAWDGVPGTNNVWQEMDGPRATFLDHARRTLAGG